MVLWTTVRASAVSRVPASEGTAFERALRGLRFATALALLALVACQPAAGKKPAASAGKPLHKADLTALGEGITHTAPTRSGPEPDKPVLSGSEEQWLESKGLYDLSKVTLPKGVVEVRLWDDIGVINGTIVQKRGSAFHGAQVFLPEDCSPGHCGGWVVALTPCVPWDQLWSALAKQGVMDPPATGGSALGGGANETYTVEVQADGKYWAKQYAPAADNGPAAQKVKAFDGVTNRSLYCH